MKKTICRPFVTLRNGKVLYAHSFGKQAFCFKVEREYVKTSSGSNQKRGFYTDKKKN